METTEICLIEQHLSKIKAASCSITDLTSFLDLLKEIASDLTNLSCEGKYRILEKDSDMFGMDLLKTRAVQEFLTILGYHEEATRYVYIPSDENYMKAESCLNLLQNYADGAEISELESSRSHDAMLKELKKGLSPKQSNSMPNLSYHSEGKEERCSGALKNILLSKHLKKEQTCEVFDSLKGALRCKKRSSTSTFNINGYFYQSCSSGRDPKKNRCFIKELFHQQGATNRSGISLI